MLELYRYADDFYYLFFKYGVGITPDFLRQLEFHGIRSGTTELYFYQHPHAERENDFVRILPGEAQFDWQHEVAAGQMYGRITLDLAQWKKEEMDLACVAEATASAIAKREPAIELRPNISGIGILAQRFP